MRLTTPFTFASTTHAIVRNGLTPVFCDIDTDSYTIDVGMLESALMLSILTSSENCFIPSSFASFSAVHRSFSPNFAVGHCKVAKRRDCRKRDAAGTYKCYVA